MGLPTSIPSGGDGLDRFSAPLPDAGQPKAPARQVAPAAPAVDPAQAEFEEFQRWKREREAMASQAASPARTQQPRTSPQPTRTRRSDAQLQQPVHSGYSEDFAEDEDGEWALDPKTGKRYKALPSTPREAIAAYKRTKGKGLSKSEMLAFIETSEDFDIDDLNGTAETFMAHLRVPPSPEEREEILRKRAEMLQRQKAERAELDAELNDTEGTLEEPEADPFNENPPKKRGLFGRKN